MFASSKKLIALAAIGAFAAGGASLAGAATKSRSSSAGDPAGQRPAQNELTGDTAAKVKAAAEGKVPGGTVLRVEDGGPWGSAYHAHVRKADGSEVVVLVDANFEATSVKTAPAGGRGGRHGHGGPGDRDGHGPGDHKAETALTGDTAAKVKAAAEAKVPGGTVERVENDSDSSSPYEAHVRKADGSEVIVLVNSNFEATSVQTHQHP